MSVRRVTKRASWSRSTIDTELDAGAKPASVGRGHSRRPPKHLTGAGEISYSSAASIAGALGLEPLERKVSALDAARISRLIARAEQRRPPGIDRAWCERLRALQPGRTELVPMQSIRPGQLQISLENVRTKMGGFIERVDARKLEDEPGPAARSLLGDEEALTAVVGPGGKYLLLLDGHHHIAALKAVDQMVESILGDCLARGAARASWKPGREIQRVHDIFNGPGGPQVPIQIVANMSELSEKEFWRVMAEGDKNGAPRTYLVDRKGRKARVGPRQFSDLEDNPFRYLASQLTGKVRRDPFRLGGAEFPVWLKLIESAPPFIEFTLARILEEAFKKAGKKYDPTQPLDKTSRTIARAALYHAKPAHEILADIPIIVRDVARVRVERELELEGAAIHASKWLTRPSKRRLARWAKNFA